MVSKSLLAAAAVTAMGLAGCADVPPGYVGGHARFDGYYDDFYGPFYNGYWGQGDAFYYSDAAGRHYRRDTAGHFRHEAVNGYHPVQGHAPPRRGMTMFHPHSATPHQ